MHDPVAAGRQTALRAIGFQAVVAGLLAVAFLAQGLDAALAAATGGAALVLGHLVATTLALRMPARECSASRGATDLCDA